MREIRMLRAMWRELEPWPGWNCDPNWQSKEPVWKPFTYRARASSRPYREITLDAHVGAPIDEREEPAHRQRRERGMIAGQRADIQEVRPPLAFDVGFAAVGIIRVGVRVPPDHSCTAPGCASRYRSNAWASGTLSTQ